MTLAVAIAQDVTSAAFVALGLAMAYRWYVDRQRGQGMLAAALMSLAVVAAVGRIQSAARPNALLSVISLVAFLASGYFVLLFRHEFIPLSRRARVAADVVLAVSIVSGILYIALVRRPPQWVVTAIAVELVGAWAVYTGEPIVRFWLASVQLPAVQKARLRFFSIGFALLIAILVVAVLAGGALQNPVAVIITQLLALASAPFIYFSFSPPSLLRRLWRISEENAVRAAMQDLLIFSPTRQVMAERAVVWAVRMVGASAGFIVDSDGKVIATVGIDPARATALSTNSNGDSRHTDAVVSIVKAPLHLTEGKGYLAVIGGPFTPVFGSDEIAQLGAYANSVSAGLERARVTERMAALEKNKTQFLNLASHELRGPLTVIRGYVSMLESGLFGDLNERGRKAADVMAAKVSEMNQLIEEMIDAARLEEGGLTLRPVEGDLRDIARSAVAVVTPLVDISHRIVLDIPDRSVRVNVDPDRTRTIVTNLLSNAIKYSPRGGQITCQVRSSRAGVARVAVSDEGLGIAREDLPTLFTRFGRVITPETEHLRGTGLGLFLSRQLARLQGGDITVVSTLGKGSTFTVQLPVAAASPADATTNDDQRVVDHRVSAGQG